MTAWQKRARLAVAVFGLVVAVVVYRSMGERERAGPPQPLERLDPTAVLETTGGLLQQMRGEEQDFEIAAARTLTYRDGSTRQFEVKIHVRGRSGRDYVITAREAHAGQGQQDLQLTGDVTLTASDGFTLRTERGSFSQADGIVRAPGDVTFSKDRLRGAGTGMSYDERSDVLRFSERSQVQTLDAADRPVLAFTSTSATLDRVRHVLTLEGGVHALRGEQVIDADRVDARLTPNQDVITFIALRGRARVSGGSGSLQSMQADDIDLDYTEDGEALERVQMMGGARLALAGPAGAEGRQLGGASLNLELAADGAITRARGQDDVQLALPATAEGVARSIRARTFEAAGVAGDGLTDARFQDRVEYEESGGAAGMRRVRSQALDTALTETGIGHARFTGNVVFEEVGLGATAAEARYQPDEGVLELRGDGAGAPRVQDAHVTIDAHAVEILLDGRRMRASGQVRTTLRPQAAAPAAAASQGAAGRLPGLLRQDETANVSADRLDYQGENGLATYTGSATLWQGETAVRADSIRLDQRSGDLLARGSARSSLALESGTSDGRADEIRYEDAQRTMTYTGDRQGDAQLSGPQGDLRAGRIELRVSPGEARTERIEAYRDVRARLDQRTVTGDRLTYLAEEERYEVSGSMAMLRAPESCREAVGRTLIFFTSTDRMIVDGNEEFRTRTISGGSCR